MRTVKPSGDLNTATILVIGHDPRLQRTQTEAEVAFFFDYLAHPRPKSRSEAKKYDLGFSRKIVIPKFSRGGSHAAIERAWEPVLLG